MARTRTQISMVVLTLGLAGCQNLPSQHLQPNNSLGALQQAQQQVQQPSAPPPLPLPVQQQLKHSNPALKPASQPLIDVAANGIDAQLFFASLAENSRYNLAVHPGVSGSISLNLKRVTLTQVMETVQDLYGYDVRINGNVIQVYPIGLRSETIPVNYLMMQRNGLSLTSVNSGRISDDEDSNSNNSDSDDNGSGGGYSNGSDSSNGTFIETRTETDFWTQLQLVLSQMVGTGPGRQVIVLPQAGLVTVKGAPAEIREVKDFLAQAETNLTRQVVLEARILEVRLSDGYQQGINWTDVSASAGNSGNIDINGSFSGNAGLGDVITGAIGGITGLTFKGEDFEAVINLLDTQGDVDTLSSPRVTAVNNQKAVIKVGTDEYFVTGFSTTTVASDNPVTTPDVELTPFFSGIALDVTPQISANGDVLLHVHPSVSEITEQEKAVFGDDFSLPLAQSEIRESDTLVRARSGDVVVIGGLMKTSTSQVESKVPLLGDIPVVGELFTNRAQEEVKTELVILLRPTVVEQGTWQQQLQQSQQLIKGWY
ncbi:pilus (MSHA type) biogenesis protein MshL [Ferrimonas senticii]|uniref:pilus (MSHA type) biogenesis protein MshL n=1 Tax=Ferrimonas senticii TaxID=394566 RepID=UPI000489DE5C|nr:pilus (MSHA type) biogenesis protein MshL [Ferrimonas senticii]